MLEVLETVYLGTAATVQVTEATPHLMVTRLPVAAEAAVKEMVTVVVPEVAVVTGETPIQHTLAVAETLADITQPKVCPEVMVTHMVAITPTMEQSEVMEVLAET